MADNSCNNSLSLELRNHVLLASGTTGIFSFLCCVVAVSMVIALRLYIHFIYRLAMYQVLASMFFSMSGGLTLMLYDYKDSLYYEVSCKMTAFIIHYAIWVKLLFTIWLTFHLFSYVVFFKNFKRLEWLYISSSVLGPLLFLWIPFIHNSYGLSGAYCIIRSWTDNCATKKYTEGIVEEFVLFHGPAFLMVVLCVVAIVTMLSVLLYRAHYSYYDDQTLLLNRDQRKEVVKKLLPLFAYPIIFLLLLLFPLSFTIYSAVSTNASFIYSTFSVVVIQLAGFFSSMALMIHLCSVQRYKRWKRCQDTTNSNAHTMEASEDFTSYYSKPAAV